MLLLAQYALLTWGAPRYAIRAIERLLGDQVTIDEIRVSLPWTVWLSGVRYRGNAADAAVTIPRIIIHPRRFWFWPPTISIKTVEVERPLVRITRTAEGTLRWPAPAATQGGPGFHGAARARSRRLMHDSLQIDALKIIDGAVEFIDAQPPAGFHAVLDHLTVNVGPLATPGRDDDQVSFAVRGLIGGGSEHRAPMYCSGWVAPDVRDLQISCQLEPLRLALFDPYFQQSHKAIRVYGATVASTSQWVAKANQLEARVHLELDRLDEGDISVHGRNIIDIKKLAPNGERRLTAEMTFGGPLDQPAWWRGDFLPGNEPTQRLVTQLLEHNIKVVEVPVGVQYVALSLAPATEEEMQHIEAVSKSMTEALEILAAPATYEVLMDVSPPLAAATQSVSIQPSTRFSPTPPAAEAPPVTAPPSQGEGEPKKKDGVSEGI